MKKLSLILPLALVLAMLGAILGATAATASSSATLKFLISGDPSIGLNVTRADNGDTITLNGTGSFTIFPKSVNPSGGGNFTHTDANGITVASGTWKPLELLSFHSFGPATPAQLAAIPDLPAGSEGGSALIHIQLLVGGMPVHDGILRVTCALGSPPTGAIEGIRLAVQDTPLNFNQIVSGATLFVR